MMHEESPPAKNSFLEDLDKLDVSIKSEIKNNFKQLYVYYIYAYVSNKAIYLLQQIMCTVIFVFVEGGDTRRGRFFLTASVFR